MTRPPGVSLFFFLAALAFIVWGVAATRSAPPGNPPPAEQQLADATDATDASAAADEAPLSDAKPLQATSAPDFSWTFNALDPGLAPSETIAAAFDPTDDYWGLPRNEGYDLVAGYCAACHSLRIVMQQRASAERWDALLDWMVEKQGMAEPPAEDRAALVRYLSEAFGA